MKILITGATGFIGSALTSVLLHKGHQVHYLTTSTEKIEQKENYKGFLWNPEQHTINEKCFDGVEAIVNLAGHTINCKWTNANKKQILNSRINSSNTLFQALNRMNHQVKHIINASAIGIYASSSMNCYDEKTTHFGNDFLADVCKQWEEANHRFNGLGIKTTIVRLGLVLSKNEGVLKELFNVVSKGLGACLGNGKQWMSWIHKDDVVESITFLLEEKLEGTFNLVAPRPVTQKEFLELLAKKLNKKMWLPNIPAYVLKLALDERAVLVLSSQQVTSSKLENFKYHFLFPGLESALNDFYQK
ncbi:MAG TPA: TIGR01777 family oxidoreductase [Flavobacterium sp.]|nr:TIGR01777 family oxidoreductase [Flavobacterium sp.]